MKKILTLFSLILFFIAGLLFCTDSACAQNVYDALSFRTAQESVIDIVNEGSIYSYNLTEEDYFLNKNENNNFFDVYNELTKSHLGSTFIENMDSFDVRITLSHSNDGINLSRVYLTQTSPRAP